MVLYDYFMWHVTWCCVVIVPNGITITRNHIRRRLSISATDQTWLAQSDRWLSRRFSDRSKSLLLIHRIDVFRNRYHIRLTFRERRPQFPVVLRRHQSNQPRKRWPGKAASWPKQRMEHPTSFITSRQLQNAVQFLRATLSFFAVWRKQLCQMFRFFTFLEVIWKNCLKYLSLPWI